MRLLLVLQLLRQNSLYKALAGDLHVSKSYISRELMHALPILKANLDEIRWPREFPIHWLFRIAVNGALDCTTHLRQEIHPNSHLLFRTDVGFPNILALIVVSLEGVPWYANFFLGHNNDQGAWHLSGLGPHFAQLGLRCLSDLGLVHGSLVRPNDTPRTRNTAQSMLPCAMLQRSSMPM